MSKPNVKMAIIILMTIVAIILSLYFYTKETASEFDGVAEEIAEKVNVLIATHALNGRHARPSKVHGHAASAPVGHNHPGDMAIWKAQIDAAPIGAYDVRPIDSNGNLSSAVFDDMKDSFKESNLMLIGNNSTDIHFLNGGLLMKGFEDHVKKPLRDDVNTNAADITDITKNEDDIGSNTSNINNNADDIDTNAGNITTASTNARKTSLADLQSVINAEIDYYKQDPGSSWWPERIGAQTAYNHAANLADDAAWDSD